LERDGRSGKIEGGTAVKPARMRSGASTPKYRQAQTDTPVDEPVRIDDRHRFCKVEGYRGLAQFAVRVETDLINDATQLHAESTPGANV
jgi:hypothetical protein